MWVKKGVVTLTNEEKILEMLTFMQSELKEVHQKVDSLEIKVDNLEIKVDNLETKVNDLAESHEETRTSVNAILEWTDTVSSVVPIVPKIS